MSLDALLDADFKTDPWDHQIREFEISAELAARALLWQMRTGKSKFCIDTASHLFRMGFIDCVLIFAPNGVHANWVEREFPKHLWDGLPLNALAWRTKIAGVKGGNKLSKADLAIWEEVHAGWWQEFEANLKAPRELSVFSFNSESMTRPDVRKAVRKLLAKRKVLVIWDESSDFRSPGSARSKMSRALARHAPYRRILDGTAVTNSPLHAFAQFELLEKGALGFARFDEFKDRYAEYETKRMRNGRTYPALKQYRNLEELRERIGIYSSVVLREDCVDLPALNHRRVKVPLSDEQKRVYAEVEKSIRIEIDRGEIATLKAQSTRLQKLQQVVGGWLVDSEKVRHRIKGVNPRLEAMSDEVFFASGKAIVCCQFQHEIDEVAARLRADGHKVMEYHGRTSDDDKKKVRMTFPTDPDVKALVVQAQSAGRGLELPADLILWYSHTWNGIIREQMSERATVMGGANVNLVDLVSPAVDPYILDTVARNVDIADDLAGRGLQAILSGASTDIGAWI